MIAATLMPFFIIMCELFNGILQPHSQMPAFWKYTMYYITPFTYWIGGVLTSILRGTEVVCTQSELTIFGSPPNVTCGEYAGAWLESKGVGYLSNPEGTGECGYCEYSVGDDVSLPQIHGSSQGMTADLLSIFPASDSTPLRFGLTLASSWLSP